MTMVDSYETSVSFYHTARCSLIVHLRGSVSDAVMIIRIVAVRTNSYQRTSNPRTVHQLRAEDRTQAVPARYSAWSLNQQLCLRSSVCVSTGECHPSVD